MKHIVEPLFVSHCILVQYCFLSFVSIILCHLCPVHEVRAKNPRSSVTDTTQSVCCSSQVTPTILHKNMTEARANLSLGGYDDEFVSAVDEDFQCPICHLPLKDTVLTEQCGHRFCRQCLEGHFTRLAYIPLGFYYV